MEVMSWFILCCVWWAGVGMEMSPSTTSTVPTHTPKHNPTQHNTSEVGLHVFGDIAPRLELLHTNITLELSQATVPVHVAIQ